MKISTFILLIMLVSQSLWALSLDDRRKKIISIIDEELSEIQRLSNQKGNRNPDYLFRMAELNFEKGRLWRDKENEVFLSLSEDTRRKVNKKKYFQQSERYFNSAIVLAQKIVRRFPNSKNIGDVYYILGHDAKEKKKLKSAERYLKKAIAKSKRNQATREKSQIALAETYYNKKYYKKATPLYEMALRSSNDRWWTKDSFNLAWSYYRSKKYSQAISKMKEVYSKSSDSRYVDMRPQVKRDIGLLFATSGKIKEGISFYESLGVDFSKELLRIAAQLKNEGKFSDAQKVLSYAEKYLKSDKDKVAVYIEQMILYEKYNRYSDHLKVVRKMFDLFKRNILNKDEIKTLSFQVQKCGAILQKKVSSKTYQVRPKLRQTATSNAKEYFEILSQINTSKRYEYTYLQAETDYANKSYTSALKNYEIAFDFSKKANNRLFMSRSVDGMLACLVQGGVSKTTKESYYISAYEKFLSIEPKSKKAYKIYEKLFKAYSDKREFAKAEEVLNRFQKIYPKSYGKQEAMIASLMDVSLKKKDYSAIKDWISKIDSGKYQVSVKYKKKLQELLTTIQIEDVQNSLGKGEKKKALVGYHKILQDPNSTLRSKINAKYNLAALYYELGAEDESFTWSMKAVESMAPKDVRNFSDSFLAISNFLFMKMYFDRSATLSSTLLDKLCKIKSRRKNIAFKNGAFISLADGKIEKTKELVAKAKTCKVLSRYIFDVEFEILKEYQKAKLWKQYEDLAESMSLDKSNWPRLIAIYKVLEDVHSVYGNTDKVKNFKNKKNRLYTYSQRKKIKIPVESLDVVAQEEVELLDRKYNELYGIKLSFPQKTFNNLVMKKLKILGELDKIYSRIEDIGSGPSIIKASIILVKAYEHVGNDLKNFTPTINLPEDQKKMFMKGFTQAMKDNYTPILLNAIKIRNEAIKTMNKYEILSESNFDLVQGSDLNVRYWSPYLGVTMDKGGRR